MRELLGAILVPLLLAPTADASTSTKPAVVPPLWAPLAAAPAGSLLHSCPWLTPRGPDRTLRIALPARFGAMSGDRRGCEASGGGIDEWVYVSPAAGTSLRTLKETRIDPRVDEGGDDSLSDVVYSSGVPVIGGRTGEALSYEAYADGSPVDVHLVQAEGVRLEWEVTDGGWPAVADDFEATAASIGIDGALEASCAEGGGTDRRVVTFAIEQEVRYVDSSPGSCDLVLRGGSFRTRAIAVDVEPVRRLGAAYRSLAARDDVRRLRRTGARQLDYRVLLASNGEPRRVRVVQDDGVRVTLTTSPHRWRGDRRLYDDLRASLATSSSSPQPGSSTARR